MRKMGGNLLVMMIAATIVAGTLPFPSFVPTLDQLVKSQFLTMDAMILAASPFLRAQHTLPYGCVRGYTTVVAASEEAAAVGFFAMVGKDYPTFIRYSNSQKGNISDGASFSVRGIGVKVFINETTAVDWIATTATRQQSTSYDVFVETALLSLLGKDALFAYIGSGQPEKIAHYKDMEFRGRNDSSLEQLRYRVQVPSHHGGDERYAELTFAPCTGYVPVFAAVPSPAANQSTWLRSRLADTLKLQPICIEWWIQLDNQTHPEMTPLDDAFVIWNTKSQLVARTVIPVQSFLDPNQVLTCEGSSFSPWTQMAAHMPTEKSSIQRVRKFYATFAAHRRSAYVRTLFNYEAWLEYGPPLPQQQRPPSHLIATYADPATIPPAPMDDDEQACGYDYPRTRVRMQRLENAAYYLNFSARVREVLNMTNNDFQRTSALLVDEWYTHFTTDVWYRFAQTLTLQASPATLGIVPEYNLFSESAFQGKQPYHIYQQRSAIASTWIGTRTLSQDIRLFLLFPTLNPLEQPPVFEVGENRFIFENCGPKIQSIYQNYPNFEPTLTGTSARSENPDAVVSFCTLAQFACTGQFQQYASMEECVVAQLSLPAVCVSATFKGNTTNCRHVHLLNAWVNPEVHCQHIGMQSQFCLDKFCPGGYPCGYVNSPSKPYAVTYEGASCAGALPEVHEPKTCAHACVDDGAGFLLANNLFCPKLAAQLGCNATVYVPVPARGNTALAVRALCPAFCGVCNPKIVTCGPPSSRRPSAVPTTAPSVASSTTTTTTTRRICGDGLPGSHCKDNAACKSCVCRHVAAKKKARFCL